MFFVELGFIFFLFLTSDKRSSLEIFPDYEEAQVFLHVSSIWLQQKSPKVF